MAAKRRGHGEGSIKQRADGLWEARVSLEGGRRRSFYGKTRREAQDKLRGALRDLDAGLDLSTERQTVTQFLDKWLSASVKPSVKVRTYEGYESIVRVRIAPRIGKRQLMKLTPLDLQSLYTELADSGLSARSIGHTHRVLHRALDRAVKWNLLSRNPCDGATAPRAQRTEMKVLTPEQVRAFLRDTVDHPAHALYTLAVTSGMRAGELLGLKWGDVDFDAGHITIQR